MTGVRGEGYRDVVAGLMGYLTGPYFDPAARPPGDLHPRLPPAAPATQLLTIGGATTAPGVALAPNGTLRFTGAPGYVASYSAAGASTGILGLPIIPKDLAVAADGSVWAIATSSGSTGNMLVHLLTNGTTQPLYVGTNQTIPDVGIVTTSKGVLFTRATGSLGLLTPAEGFQLVNLPDDTDLPVRCSGRSSGSPPRPGAAPAAPRFCRPTLPR